MSARVSSRSSLPSVPDPLVSILIPCHNAGAFLDATLGSAFAQTWPRCEIILVDDGSTDDSFARARAWESRGLRMFTQPNRGASAARNAALRAARGEFIQYLDADDLLAPTKIERQLARARSAPAGAVFTGRWGRFTARTEETVFPDANPLFADLAPRDYLLRYGSQDCMMHPAAWLLPRALAERTGPWDERLSLNDDGEYFARVVTQATAIVHCGDAVSYYRSALSTSLSAQRRRRHLDSAYLALTSITEKMLAFENTAAMRRAAADLHQRFAYDYYPAAPDLVELALRRATALGGSSLRPLGGKIFQALSRIIGWRAARRWQVRLGKFPAPAADEP